MTKVDEIKNQLAQRLDKQVEQPKSSAPRARAQTSAQPQAVTSLADTKKRVGNQPDAHSQGVVKLSVSLYNFDIDRLDKIKDFMRKHGVRNLSDSEAMRLACRAANVNDDFLAIHETMLREDQRRSKSQ
jgi:hypothetical protein